MVDAASIAQIFTPRETDFMRAPEIAYRRLRRDAPVWLDPESGVYFVSTYALAEEVMRHHGRFSSQVDRRSMRAGELPPEAHRLRARAWRTAATMSHNDTASHGDYRKLVAAFFMPRWLARMQPFIEERAAALLDAIDAQGGECDFLPSFAVPLPVSVIGEYLGMRHLGDEVLKQWSDAFADELGFLTSDARAIEIAQQTLDCHDAMVALCAERRGGGRDDIITHLANARLPDGRPLDNAELLSILTQLLVAGNETTTATLGFALLRLGQDRPMFERLRAGPALIPAFVEEVLRLDSPIQGQFRRAVGQQQLGGVTIPDGALLHVRFGSANRDEAVWGDDDGTPAVDRRPPRPHMAFGNGIHFCVGAALSRLEMKIALTMILARYGRVVLGCDPHALTFRTNFHQRGLTGLPLALQA